MVMCTRLVQQSQASVLPMLVVLMPLFTGLVQHRAATDDAWINGAWNNHSNTTGNYVTIPAGEKTVSPIQTQARILLLTLLFGLTHLLS